MELEFSTLNCIFWEIFVQFNPINGLTQNKISQELLDSDCKKKQIYIHKHVGSSSAMI